jgi:hypothetical protein
MKSDDSSDSFLAYAFPISPNHTVIGREMVSGWSAEKAVPTTAPHKSQQDKRLESVQKFFSFLRQQNLFRPLNMLWESVQRPLRLPELPVLVGGFCCNYTARS